jgi:predicted phosphohydrolase
MSDLHFEFGQPFVQSPPSDTDVLVCAGDLLTRGIVPSIEWLATHIPTSIPVVFTAGNHEYYGASVLESIRDARSLRDRYPHIHFLENEAVDIGDVRFVGATLWTDFRINGGDPELAMAAAQSGMNDYRRIKLSKLPYQKFKPIHAYRKHHESRAFLKSALDESTAWKTVVLSHHAPSPRSIPPEFRGDPLSACYGSDLEDLIVEGQPALWVHGHVHQKVDCRVGMTRLIANPRGYPGEGTAFDPQLVIEI